MKLNSQVVHRFRWAFLQMQSLKALRVPITPVKVENKLRTLPKDLDETYTRMLNGLDDYDKPTARSALAWLVFSSRQLYIEELIDAAAIRADCNPLLGDRLTPYDLESLLQNLIAVQPPLRLDSDGSNNDKIVPQTHTVMLAHASIREFLVRENLLRGNAASEDRTLTLDPTDSHVLLAVGCLSYLLCYNTYGLRHQQTQFPLRKYAWYHWEHHISTQALSCVPTSPMVVLRRKAVRDYGSINQYMQFRAGHINRELLLEKLGREALGTFSAILEPVARVADINRISFHSLLTTMNIPFFHPDFDQFCPVDPTARHPDGILNSGTDQLLKLLGIPDSPQSYSHRPLPRNDTPSIRLLEILPALDPVTTIRCRLFDTPLKDAPPYAALSYMWGNGQHNKHKVLIEGHSFGVLGSQIILLQSMRSRSESLNPALWIDGLCIALHDAQEKLNQVSLMSSIFSQAREVVICLSNNDATDEESIHQMTELAAVLSPLSNPTHSKEAEDTAQQKILQIHRGFGWKNTLRIFEHVWWERLWIVAECVLASRLVILFGTMSLSFDIVEQVLLADDYIEGVLRQGDSAKTAVMKKSPGWHAAQQIVRTRLDLRAQKRPDLLVLLWRFRHSKASFRNDRIFALLNICDPSSFKMMEDYSLSIADMGLWASRWMLKEYNNLDLLSLRSTFSSVADSQDCEASTSWSLPLGNGTPQRQPLNVGRLTGLTPRAYSAAGIFTGLVLIDTEEQHTLATLGMRFDKVASVLGSFHSARELFHTLSCIHSHFSVKEEDQSLIEIRWRTVLADQWPPGKRLDASACGGARVPPRTAEEEKALLAVINLDYHLPLLKDRRVIITAGGRLGLANDEVVPGDLIVVIPGGSLLYSLRPSSDGCFTFLGEWSVDIA